MEASEDHETGTDAVVAQDTESVDEQDAGSADVQEPDDAR